MKHIWHHFYLYLIVQSVLMLCVTFLLWPTWGMRHIYKWSFKCLVVKGCHGKKSTLCWVTVTQHREFFSCLGQLGQIDTNGIFSIYVSPSKGSNARIYCLLHDSHTKQTILLYPWSPWVTRHKWVKFNLCHITQAGQSNISTVCHVPLSHNSYCLGQPGGWDTYI